MTSPDTTDLGLGANLGLIPQDFVPIAKMARHKLDAGQNTEALEMYSNLVMAFPLERSFQLGVASAALAADLPVIALTAANAAVAMAPEKADGYLLCGQACLAMGEADAAREDLEQAIQLSRSAQKAGNHKQIEAVARKCLTALDADYD